MSGRWRIVNTAMRAAASALLAVLFLQPILAGRYFAGDADAIGLHGSLGEIAAWLALLQASLAIVLAAKRAMAPLVAAGFVALFALTGLQVHFGHLSALDLHVPLGASLLALSLLATAWLFGAAPTPARS